MDRTSLSPWRRPGDIRERRGECAYEPGCGAQTARAATRGRARRLTPGDSGRLDTGPTGKPVWPLSCSEQGANRRMPQFVPVHEPGVTESSGTSLPMGWRRRMALGSAVPNHWDRCFVTPWDRRASPAGEESLLLAPTRLNRQHGGTRGAKEVPLGNRHPHERVRGGPCTPSGRAGAYRGQGGSIRMMMVDRSASA